jgi:hypothetical protein
LSIYENIFLTENMGSYLLPEKGNPIEEDWVAYEHAAVITNTTVNYVKGMKLSI